MEKQKHKKVRPYFGQRDLAILYVDCIIVPLVLPKKKKSNCKVADDIY
jgi:hypothetical protein